MISVFKNNSHVNWALADQAMVSGVNFLTGILFARYLGIEEFGRFTLAWMAVLFMNSIQMAMISTPMMTIGPKQNPKEESDYYGVVIWHQVCFGIFTFLLLWSGVQLSVIFFPDWHIENLALPLASAGVFFQTQDFLRRFFFTRGRHGAAFLNDAVSYLGQIVLLIVFFLTMPLDTKDVFLIIAATSGIAVGLGCFLLGEISWHPEGFKKIFFRHYHFSKWITASAVLQWTSGNLFVVAAGGTLGATAVGAMKAAQNIMAVSHVLFQGMENIVPIQASLLYSRKGIKGLLVYLKKVSLWGGFATASIALLASIFPEQWLRLFYGLDYTGYGFVLRWYAIIYLFIFMGLPLRSGLRAMEISKPIFLSYVIMTVFSMISFKYLLSTFGIAGALSGILGTQIILQGSLFIFLYKYIREFAIQ